MGKDDVMEKAKLYWNSKTPSFKRNFIISGVLLGLTVSTFVYLYTKDNYTFLMTATDSSMAANVINKLESEGVKYDVKGNSIYVSGVNADSLKLQISGDGTLDTQSAGVDWSSSKLFISEKQQDKLIQSDLENSIALAIKSYNEVNSAKVLLTIGSQSSFKNDNVPSKAAIQVDLKNKLNNKQINSIQQFVAASVPNLDKADVVITDTNNNLLSGSEEASLEYNDAYTKKIEDSLSDKIHDLLRVAFPTSNFKVVSKVEVNFDSTKIEKETVQSGPDTIVSQEKTSEKTTNGNASGTAGVESNVPSYETSKNDSNIISEKNSEVINYELNKVNEQVIKSPEVKRLSVAVIADKELNEDELGKIQDLVETAALINEERGDKVSVQGFATNIEGNKVSFFEENLGVIIKNLVLGLLIIAILIIALRIISLFAKNNSVIKDKDDIPYDDLSLNNENSINGSSFNKIITKDGSIEYSNDIEEDLRIPTLSPKAMRKRETVGKALDENSAQVASVLKVWKDKN